MDTTFGDVLGGLFAWGVHVYMAVLILWMRDGTLTPRSSAARLLRDGIETVVTGTGGDRRSARETGGRDSQ